MNMGVATSSLNLLNFGNYYYPQANLRENLERLIIFTENAAKKEIPNGSVFIYNCIEYNPQILKSDIGCGITAFILQSIDFDDETTTEILKAINELGIHIGQGNHFLDFTTAHPVLRRKNKASRMIYLHSDFNNENIVPTSYSEAKKLENKAKDQRYSYLEKLTRLLGISAEFYMNWTHNSVNLENDRLVYRKGAINLSETKGIGVLALNPIEGLMLYAAEFKDYHYSMQHGLGRTGSRGELQNVMQKKRIGIARGYIMPKICFEIKEILERTYNPIDNYLRNFGLHQSQIGVCVPELVVTTKL